MILRSIEARRLLVRGFSPRYVELFLTSRTNNRRFVQSLDPLRSYTTQKKSSTASTELLFQDTPVERSEPSSIAFESLAKPDFFKDPKSFSHPIPAFIEDGPSSSFLQFNNGQLSLYDPKTSRSSKIPGMWLRDNCPCSQCRNMDTAQRQVNVLKGSVNCDIMSCETGVREGEFTVEFGDGHRVSFSLEFLIGRESWNVVQRRYGIVPIKTWTAKIKSAPPAVNYTDVIAPNGLATLLHQIRVYGFCFVDKTPATPEATESLLSRIGPIRNTHYGAFYDFTADLSSKDTAYTSEHLDPHTDNTYFTEPAGLQALHLLSHTHSPSGGLSSLVDGFSAAQRLYISDRAAYLTLSRVGVHAHASGNEGVSIQPSSAFPTLNHDPRSGFLTQVRWNNADRAGVAVGLDGLEAWYDAAAKWEAILSDEQNQYWFQLTPGKLLIFDNWRALHGRSAFTGKRRMCGGYINRDDFISRYRTLNLSQKDLEATTVTG